MEDDCFFDHVREAMESGDTYRVRKLLQLDVEWKDETARRLHRALTVNARDESGRTYLMHAASRGDLDMVRLLVEAGADPNALAEHVVCDLDRAQYGWTAKQQAAARGHWSVVDYLAPLTRPRAKGKSPSCEMHDERTNPPSQDEPFDELGR
jgi:ankyrin repeat protein